MNAYTRFAVTISREAGLLLKERLPRKRNVSYKGVVNLVTEMDLLSEKMIVAAIRRQYPEHSILAEERTSRESDSPYRWIVDPLDGTTNYAHGYPIFCVSIALERKGRVIAGVVYDPSRDELFWAEEGKGARLNGRKIHGSAVPRLSQALLATGFPYDLRDSDINNLDHFGNFAVRAQAVRRAGSAALDLCYVAAGRFDGYWELKLSLWDWAAARLIVAEAGGKTTDFSGKPLNVNDRNILASNGKIHREMMAVLKMGKM